MGREHFNICWNGKLVGAWIALASLGSFGLTAMLSSCLLVEGRKGDTIVFPLLPHADLMASCGICHEDIATNDVTSETRRAVERSCLECHAEQAQNCTYCHTDPDNAGVFPAKERNLSFSHANHLVRTAGDCSVCHPGPHGGAQTQLAASHPTQIPDHPECFSCHEMQGFYDNLKCQNCHEALFEYGLKPYDTFSHSADWLDREHGDFVNSSENMQTCAQCHEQTFCSDCHFQEPFLRLWEKSPEKIDRDFIHAGDYVYRHMWDVRASAASCMRCHSQNWCNDCHDHRGVSLAGSGRRTGGFQFHGPGVLLPGSPDFHGTAARRDIISCAACHSEGSSGNCVDCHQVGAFGGNPHPPGFKSRLSRTGAPVCRLCHR